MSATLTPVQSTNKQPVDAGTRGLHGLRSLWRMATANGKVTIGLVIVAFFVLLALIGPLFVASNPNAFGSDISLSPSGAHPLGTTSYGQDVLAQVVVGARVIGGVGLHHWDHRD